MSPLNSLQLFCCPHLVETDFMGHKNGLIVFVTEGVQPKDAKDPSSDVLKWENQERAVPLLLRTILVPEVDISMQLNSGDVDGLVI